MTATFNFVLECALQLPVGERSRIAARLMESVDEGAELSPAWCAELEARVQRRQSGETRSYSREEVSAELEAILT